MCNSVAISPAMHLFFILFWCLLLENYNCWQKIPYCCTLYPKCSDSRWNEM